MDLTNLDAYLEKQTLDFYYNNLNNSKGFFWVVLTNLINSIQMIWAQYFFYCKCVLS